MEFWKKKICCTRLINKKSERYAVRKLLLLCIDYRFMFFLIVVKNTVCMWERERKRKWIKYDECITGLKKNHKKYIQTITKITVIIPATWTGNVLQNITFITATMLS